MESLIQDLRHALRTLVRAPGFAVVAVLTLALGIGANTTIFSAVRAVMLRPLPFQAPDELVQLFYTFREGEGTSHSPSNFFDLRSENRSFTELAAINTGSSALTGDGGAEQVPSANVTGGFFGVLAVPATLGRTISLADAEPGAPPVVVLSHALWQRRFGSDRAIVGRTIQLNGTAREVVGVMPRGFSFPEEREIWTPISFTADDLATQRGAWYLDVIGRLRPGVTVEQARADITRIWSALERQYPSANDGLGGIVYGLREAIVGDVSTALFILLGAVGCVLLIACVNVANLLMVRGVGRSRELAIRTALGADRFRLLRGHLAESVVLALVGGGAGLLIAVWGGAAIRGMTAAGVPFLSESRIDLAVLGFTIALSLVTGLLFGLLPAAQAARIPDLASRLRQESGSSIGDRSRHRVRHGLVVAELALATILLVGAGLLTRSLVALTRVDLGLNTANALSFGVNLPGARYETPERRAIAVSEAVERLRAMPGVQHAGAVFGMPLTGFSYTISGLVLDGRTLDNDEQTNTSVSVRTVTPDFFAAAGIPLRRGRGIEATDRAGATEVMVVNEAAARLLWPGQNPIGRTFRIGSRLGQGGEQAGGEVVGVVGDVRERGPSNRAGPTIFLPHAQRPMSGVTFVLRTSGDPAALVEPARAVIAALDADLPIFRVRTLEELASNSVAQPRLYAALLGIFAAVSLLLAAIGVYGVMAYGVRSRTREIGVRIALGADREAVVRMVAGHGALLAGAGIVIGLAASLLASRLMRGLLFGIEPSDPATFIVVPVCLATTALLACWLPARRAARVDPMVALRSE